MPQLGSAPEVDNGGSGYISVSQYRQILEHAKMLHIQVIPEFDMPGQFVIRDDTYCSTLLRSFIKYSDCTT